MRKIINYFYIIIFFFSSTIYISAENYYLKENWFYTCTNDPSSWKPIDITKSLKEQGIILKKGDYIYLKTTIDLKDVKNKLGDDSEMGVYFGKIEGFTDIYLNKKFLGFWYNEKTIFFELKDYKTLSNIEILLKIKKIYSLYPNGRLEVVPYICYFSTIQNQFLILYFLQMLVAISILIMGIYYALYYNKKLNNYEFLLLFVLCFMVSVYSFALSPICYYLNSRFNFNIEFMNFKIRLISLYLQPFIGILFTCKIFQSNIKLSKIIIIITGMISLILFMFVIIVPEIGLIMDSLVIFHPFTIICVCIYIFQAFNSLMKKNYDSLYVLIGLFLFSAFSLLDIIDNWQFVNIVNRHPVYTFGFFFFDFLLGTYLSRKFVKVNLNLLELTKTLENKIKERTKKIEEISRHRTDFFANISHELRTPLTLILGPVEEIISGKYGNSINYNDNKLRMILYNGTKLLNLINNLLDFTKIESGKTKINKQNINVSELLKFYVSTVKSTAENRGLNIVFNDNNTEGRLIANIDKEMLEKAIFNLIFNSLKFTDRGGQIIVQLDKMENTFEISIKDNGIGIPKDKLDTIFERFTQLDSSVSRKYEGTGIGLALTKEIVEMLGGKISVKSKLNEGSVFTIELPYEMNEDNILIDEIDDLKDIKSHVITEMKEENKDLNIVKDDEEKSRKERKKILIVEDNIDMQKYLKSILEDEYVMSFASNGVEGIKKAEKDNPDLILADVMMPKMDGYKMTEMIKSKEDFKGIPVILLTAKADIFMKVEGFKRGADDYIIKPFDSKELCARIRTHISIKELRDKEIRSKEELEKLLDEKIKAQRQLVESEKRFREMAENLPVAIIEIDFKHKTTYVNKYSKELLGILIGDDLLDYFDIKIKDKIKKNIVKLYQKDSLEINQYELKSRNGEKIKALIKFNTLYKENNVEGIRVAIFELEPNCNIVLMPDKTFYEKYGISEREKEVIMLLVKGLSYNEIGEKLFISYKTVDKHVSNIYEKTSVNNRFSLINLIQGSQEI